MVSYETVKTIQAALITEALSRERTHNFVANYSYSFCK